MDFENNILKRTNISASVCNEYIDRIISSSTISEPEKPMDKPEEKSKNKAGKKAKAGEENQKTGNGR